MWGEGRILRGSVALPIPASLVQFPRIRDREALGDFSVDLGYFCLFSQGWWSVGKVGSFLGLSLYGKPKFHWSFLGLSISPPI